MKSQWINKVSHSARVANNYSKMSLFVSFYSVKTSGRHGNDNLQLHFHLFLLIYIKS